LRHTYFNNAAGAYPLAPGVIESVTQALHELPRAYGRDNQSNADSMQQCRALLAQLLSVSASQIVLTNSATYGLNAALLGLDLKRDDLVISTVMEHDSVLRPLAYLEDHYGVRVEYVPLDDKAKLDKSEYDKLLGKNPRLVAITHASNVTGRINPVKSWFEDAKKAGAITLLDASQTAGRIPVLPGELNADIVVFPGHKGLRGPLGSGVLYISPQVTIHPVFTGGTGTNSHIRSQPEDLPMRLEPGTPNSPAYAGLNAALRYYMKHAPEIAINETVIMERLLAGLLDMPDVHVFDTDHNDRLPIVSFTFDKMDAETAGLTLSESFGIECRAGLHCAPLMHQALGETGSVRLSPSYENSTNDINYVIEAVRIVAV